MQLRTILNRVYKLPGFVYGKIRLVEREGGQAEVEVEVLPRANGRARCSGCGEPGPCYDRRERRRYQFVPVLGLPTYLIYEMRRVDCRSCGKVKVERVPWAEGKQRSTKAYLRVVAERAPAAVHVLDRFHIVQKLGKAIDEVRAGEAKQLRAQGEEPVLKNARWLLLKRKENLSEEQEPKLAELVKLNLRTVRAHLLKEDFQQFWECRSPTAARRFLVRWCRRAMRSRLEPMKKVAKMLRRHRPLVLNWFRTGRSYSSGAVEGMNLKAKLAMRKAYWFRSYRSCELALYHSLGNLPEHSLAHRFC